MKNIKTLVDERAKHKDENEKIEEQLKQISFNWFVDLSFEEFIQKCIFQEQSLPHLMLFILQDFF